MKNVTWTKNLTSLATILHLNGIAYQASKTDSALVIVPPYHHAITLLTKLGFLRYVNSVIGVKGDLAIYCTLDKHRNKLIYDISKALSLILAATKQTGVVFNLNANRFSYVSVETTIDAYKEEQQVYETIVDYMHDHAKHIPDFDTSNSNHRATRFNYAETVITVLMKTHGVGVDITIAPTKDYYD
jgi:hypothetical protein